jgi:hypothetical protein
MGERKDYAYGHSDYLKADELAGKSARVVISNVEDVEFDKGLKPVLSFEGKKKRLVVNATNFDILCAGISNNTNDWVGHVITLRGEKTSFRGKLVNSIRVSVPKESKQAKTADFDDGIPSFGDAAWQVGLDSRLQRLSRPPTPLKGAAL